MGFDPRFECLTEDSFMMYAMKAYNNPGCLDIKEFHDDLTRIKYIKRLLNRYVMDGELKERLILNHIIVLYNVFGPEAATKILFYKVNKKFWVQLKTFLVFLNYMPSVIYGIDDKPIISSDIPIDMKIAAALRQI